MTYARHHLVTPDAPGTYHCTSRCVRRAFLCGVDALTGRSFEHRKEWVERRLLSLSKSFAVSIYAYAVMSNHLHVVVHIDPLAPHNWSDEQVARRWARVYGGTSPNAPAFEQRVQALMANKSQLDTLRQRLGSLSYFMSALVQPIARRANREDGVTGRFWEGRFRSQALLDERAVLACMAYVDLNPMRAGTATCLEQAQHTSVKRRIEHGIENRALKPLAGTVHAPMPELSQCAYLALLRWSWHATNETERPPRSPPAQTSHFVLHPQGWVRQLASIESRYGHAVGSLDALLQRAIELRQKWLRGVRFARSINQHPHTLTSS